MIIDIKEFETLLHSINRCYAKGIADKLPRVSDFSNAFQGQKTDTNLLLNLLDHNSNIYFKSVLLRLVAIAEFRHSRDLGLKIDTSKVYSQISKSIQILPSDATISSIGSQGFLSIPLFRYDNDIAELDFIRLHIWDNSLKKYIDNKICENFSIHTHTFHAESWIVCGKILNNRFKVEKSDTASNYSLFIIAYNESLNEVNQHTSSANNTNTFVSVYRSSEEIYNKGDNYSINAGDFHSSNSEEENGLSATLFCFNAQKGFVEQSYVVGPSDIASSVINRKMHIDPTGLINRINEKIKSNERKT